jgi:hypothetical protein
MNGHPEFGEGSAKMKSPFSDEDWSIEGVFKQVGQQQNATRRKFAQKERKFCDRIVVALAATRRRIHQSL